MQEVYSKAPDESEDATEGDKEEETRPVPKRKQGLSWRGTGDEDLALYHLSNMAAAISKANSQYCGSILGKYFRDIQEKRNIQEYLAVNPIPLPTLNGTSGL